MKSRLLEALETFGVCLSCHSGEHQMELLDFVAAKFHEEGGVFKLLVTVSHNHLLVGLSVCSCLRARMNSSMSMQHAKSSRESFPALSVPL